MNAEDIEQIIVVDWVKQCTDLPVIHIANQRQTSPQHGAMLKRMGVRAGVADLFFLRGSKGYSGMFIELKSTTGKPTKAQIDFLDEAARENYFTTIAYGSKAAIDTIKHFYGL